MTEAQLRYGTWRSPITAEMVRRRVSRVSRALPRGRRSSTGSSDARPRGAGPCSCAAIPGLRADRRHAGGVQRADDGARVRRRRLLRSTTASASSRTSRTSACTGWMPDGDPVAITPDTGGARIATRTGASRPTARCRSASASDTTASGPADVVNEFVVLPPDGSADPVVIAGGRDFYATPADRRPTDAALAWLAWDQPWMPWDGCELSCRRLADDGSVSGASEPSRVGRRGVDLAARVEPGRRAASSSPIGRGWWNLYRVARRRASSRCTRSRPSSGSRRGCSAMRSYGFLDDGRIACSVRARRRSAPRDARSRDAASCSTSICRSRRSSLPTSTSTGSTIVVHRRRRRRSPAQVVSAGRRRAVRRRPPLERRGRRSIAGYVSVAARRSSSRPTAGGPRTRSSTRRRTRMSRGPTGSCRR